MAKPKPKAKKRKPSKRTAAQRAMDTWCAKVNDQVCTIVCGPPMPETRPVICAGGRYQLRGDPGGGPAVTLRRERKDGDAYPWRGSNGLSYDNDGYWVHAGYPTRHDLMRMVF